MTSRKLDFRDLRNFLRTGHMKHLMTSTLALYTVVHVTDEVRKIELWKSHSKDKYQYCFLLWLWFFIKYLDIPHEWQRSEAQFVHRSTTK